MSRPSRISVIIPTLNRYQDLEACLRSLVVSGGDGLREVIVIDDAADVPVDIPAELLDQLPVTVSRNEQRLGAALTRNRAVATSSGDVLAFLDDDARVLPDWFEVAHRWLDRGSEALTGRVLPFDLGIVSRSRQWRYEQRYGAHNPGDAVTFFAGGNSLILTDRFRTAGGFPDQLTAGDNALVEGLTRHGVPVTFAPDLRILHRNGKGFAEATREAYRAGLVGHDGPAEALNTARKVFGQLRQAPPPIRAVNGGLQLARTAGALRRSLGWSA